MFRKLKPHQLVVDVVLTLACILCEYFVVGFSFSLVALAGMATALAFRRLSPTLALAFVWATALIQVFFNIGADPSNLAILPVLYATASYGSPLVKWLGLASTGAGAFVMTAYLLLPSLKFLTSSPWAPVAAMGQFAVIFFSSLAIFALSWTLGILAKTWRNSRESTQARILAERAQIDAQHAVIIEQERNRIARDMHDVVAHSLAVVIAQADGARYARENDPGAVDSALATISSTARDALGDVRILLGQLRHSPSDSPQPVLADLEKLYGQMRAAGLSLRVETSGVPPDAPGGVQLTMFRIVQEALTNALRHGDARDETKLNFQWSEESLHLSVHNSVADVSASVANRDESSALLGHGLSGMTERAVLVGGSLDAREEDRHFIVDVVIPVATSAPATLSITGASA